MADLVRLVATVVGLLALVGVTNILCWYGIQRAIPGRPWHWTVVIGCFAYYPWLNRQERLAKDAESAERCAKAERLLAEVNARAASINRRHYWRQDPTTGMFYGYHEDPPEDLMAGIYAEIMKPDARTMPPWADPSHDALGDIQAAIKAAEGEPYRYQRTEIHIREEWRP
jgi:hypothetical protein